MRLVVINGPNLNLLGAREPDIYGGGTHAELAELIEKTARDAGVQAELLQYNGEGEIIDAIHAAMGRADGLILNPGAYTHYSYAIHDAIRASGLDAVEVHLSNIAAREAFRSVSVTAPACVGQISGLGFYGYAAAIRFFAERTREACRT